MSSVWYKTLHAIDIRNKILQARNATLDIEVANIESLLEDLNQIRSSWDKFSFECKIVAEHLGISTTFKTVSYTHLTLPTTSRV